MHIRPYQVSSGQRLEPHLHAWPGVRDAAEEAVQHDPAFALAHALRALDAPTYLRRAEARDAIELAQRFAPQASEREQSHVAVIALLLGGKSALALDAALVHAARWPTDALLASTPWSARSDCSPSRAGPTTMPRAWPSCGNWRLTIRLTTHGCCRTEAGAASKLAN